MGYGLDYLWLVSPNERELSIAPMKRLIFVWNFHTSSDVHSSSTPATTYYFLSFFPHIICFLDQKSIRGTLHQRPVPTIYSHPNPFPLIQSLALPPVYLRPRRLETFQNRSLITDLFIKNGLSTAGNKSTEGSTGVCGKLRTRVEHIPENAVDRWKDRNGFHIQSVWSGYGRNRQVQKHNPVMFFFQEYWASFLSCFGL